MGTVATITATRFPTQGAFLHKHLWVCFHYDTTQILHGHCIRDDTEPPYRMLIQLDDGRVILADECQYTEAGG